MVSPHSLIWGSVAALYVEHDFSNQFPFVVFHRDRLFILPLSGQGHVSFKRHIKLDDLTGLNQRHFYELVRMLYGVF